MAPLCLFLTRLRALLTQKGASQVTLAVSSALLYTSACARPDCRYYQHVDIESEILESSEDMRSVKTYLHVVPEKEAYPTSQDSIVFQLQTGTVVDIENVLRSLVNGRSDQLAEHAIISANDLDRISCRVANIEDFTIRIESSNVIGEVHDDHVDPDFQSSSVLYLKADDPDFLSKCGLEQPFEIRVRLTTDASMVKVKTAPSIHGCRER